MVRKNNLLPTFALLPTLFVAIGMLLAASPTFGQSEQVRTPVKGIGLPQDWSTRHILFTNGISPSAFAASARDPHTWYGWMQRNGNSFRNPGREPLPRPQARPRVDWAVSLGAKGGMPIGETPAKYSFSTSGNITTANCTTDFVVFVVNGVPALAGTTPGQANIVALNNLYTGTASSFCPFGPQTPPTTDYTAPTFLFSYAAGSGAVTLSPALSEDGTKVAFLENTNPVEFDVLTWVAGQGTDATHPVAPGSGGSSLVRLNYTNSVVPGCSAGAASSSDASPYIDFNTDSAYLGADNGALYRVTGVFKGTPTLEYCIVVNSGKTLTSPVYDQVNNVVYVSDGYSVYGFTPGATGFTAAGSIAVASTAPTNPPIVLSPYLDTGNGFVYVFSQTDLTNTNAIVSQINLALTSQVTAAIGPKASTFILDGDFDNAYFTSGPTTGAGTLYACGTDMGNNTKPSLYALSFSAPTGLMNSTPAVSDNRNINGASNASGECSPFLDFFDGTTDRLFIGAGNYLHTTGSNLVTEWNVNTRIGSSSTMPNNTATGYWGGTSAFTVDNVSTEPQAASIYFGTLQAPPTGTTTPCGAGNYCAVKLTQSGLQ